MRKKNSSGAKPQKETPRAAKWAKRAGAVLAALVIVVCAAFAIAPATAASTTNTGGFSLASLASAYKMFYGCGELVGQNGTTYNSNVTDAEGAVVDKTDSPGYFTTETGSTYFAIYSADDGSLTFYHRTYPPTLEVGDIYDGRTVTTVYMGGDGFMGRIYSSYTEVPWYADGNYSNVKSVVVEDTVIPYSTAWWFYGMTNCESIDLSGLNTVRVTDMTSMFHNCSSLTDITFGDNFITYHVTDMTGMFNSCSSLTGLDLSCFNTRLVEDMTSMFGSCVSLESLDLSGWDTSSVTVMCAMFAGCISLESLDLSGWDTSGVTNMLSMFSNCTGLTELDLSSFDTSGVTTMLAMFSSCTGLTELDLSSFDTSEVSVFYAMFAGCTNLEKIIADENKWSTESCNTGSGSSMFQGCTSLAGYYDGGSYPYDSDNVSYTYAVVCNSTTPGYLTSCTLD